jgi:outer membrane protein assembly factor BamD
MVSGAAAVAHECGGFNHMQDRGTMGFRHLVKTLALLAMVAPVAACSSLSMFSSEQKLSVDTQPPEVLYKDADTLLTKGDYTKAAEKFEEVDRQHPYSKEARLAILMSAVAYQKADKLPEAVASARRYLTLHPGTKEAALAQHIIATAYYERINDPTRDQADTKKALVELETLVSIWPPSTVSAPWCRITRTRRMSRKR